MGAKDKKIGIEKEAKTLVEKILAEMGFEAKVEIEDSEAVNISITGEDLGLLIGQYGSNLESLQTVLALIINKKFTQEWKPVVVDVNRWRKEKEETIKNLVARELAKLGDTGQAKLPPMPPSQRRFVHLLVSDYAGIASESVGEEPYRSVVIKRQPE